ncbi:Mediator of RNA polymerase II transcription subunit 10 [Mactra antiquata]
MADRFENLEEQLERFIENTRQLGIIVSDFQPQGQNALNQKLQTMVQGMQEIDKMKGQMQDVHVPLEVFEYIDQGKNPNLYTKHCLEKALGKNEQVKGKIDAFKKFKALLVLELSDVFPKEMANYRAMRGDDRPA